MSRIGSYLTAGTIAGIVGVVGYSVATDQQQTIAQSDAEVLCAGLYGCNSVPLLDLIFILFLFSLLLSVHLLFSHYGVLPEAD